MTLQNMLGVMYEMTKNENVITQMPFTPSADLDPIEQLKQVRTIVEPAMVPTKWKYNEEEIVDDLYDYLKSTYGEHYTTDSDDSIQCFDAWIAMGDATPTFRNTAIKYLWRYGKKNGNNKKDLMKALHYIVLCLHNDHYKDRT